MNSLLPSSLLPLLPLLPPPNFKLQTRMIMMYRDKPQARAEDMILGYTMIPLAVTVYIMICTNRVDQVNGLHIMSIVFSLSSLTLAVTVTSRIMIRRRRRPAAKLGGPGWHRRRGPGPAVSACSRCQGIIQQQKAAATVTASRSSDSESARSGGHSAGRGPATAAGPARSREYSESPAAGCYWILG